MLQQYRQQQKEVKTLWELLADETSVAAEASLASLPTDENLLLLSQLYTRTEESLCTGAKRQYWALIIGFTGYIIYIIGPFPRNFFVGSILLGLIFYGYSFQKERKRLRRRQANILRLIPGLLASADRFALGSLLELTEVLRNARLAGDDREMRIQLQIHLSQLLARAPTDALQALSQRQRACLRFLTEDALESCWGDSRYESLAVAGLLALTTLKDSHFQTAAQTEGRQVRLPVVQAALEEYLTQVAK